MTQTATGRQALVLSGGSVYAAYEVGVVRALFAGLSPATAYRPIDPAIYVGTSAGAVNASLLVSKAELGRKKMVEYLEWVWLERLAGDATKCREGAIRIRGDIGRYLDFTCFQVAPLRPLQRLAEDSLFFSTDLLKSLARLPMSSQPFGRQVLASLNVSALISKEAYDEIVRKWIDLEPIRRSSKIFRIAATNWKTGELQLFKNEDMTDEVGHDAILASSAFPGIPPVNIAGVPYVDGGYVMNTPLRPAWDEGADVFHVIYMDPDIDQIPLQEIENTFDVFDKLYHIMMASIFNNAIELAEDINLGLALLDQVEKNLAIVDTPEIRALLRLSGRMFKAPKDAAPYRKLTIHRYHPGEDLGGVLGLMNFDRSHVLDLIHHGYNDAVHHDCRASGCLLPDQLQ